MSDNMNNEFEPTNIEPIDDATLFAYLQAVEDSTPNLWDRIEAGINNNNVVNFNNYSQPVNGYSNNRPEVVNVNSNSQNNETDKRIKKLKNKKIIGFALMAAALLIIAIPTYVFFIKGNISKSDNASTNKNEVMGVASDEAYDSYEDAAADNSYEAPVNSAVQDTSVPSTVGNGSIDGAAAEDKASNEINEEDVATNTSSVLNDWNVTNVSYSVTITNEEIPSENIANFTGYVSDVQVTGGANSNLANAVADWRSSVLSEAMNRKLDFDNEKYADSAFTIDYHVEMKTALISEKYLSLSVVESYNVDGTEQALIYGVTFDAETGKTVTLKDMGVNKNELMAYVKDSLAEDYSDKKFVSDYEDVISENIGDCWYLAEDGIIIIFNPYTLTDDTNDTFIIRVPYNNFFL